MASPFQQEALRRKIVYIGLIIALFTVAFLWRKNAVASQAQALALREADRGDVELTGSVVRLTLTGSRGLATCALWMSAIEKQKRNQWNELELLVRSITKLQPHFITPWLFQSWNLAYNVSVESDRVRDKYFYVTRGVELLAEGERQNRNNPDLRFWLGFYVQHKVCKSDETNVQRSLFQLSLMPPNERDPARFTIVGPNGEESINYVEFEKLCKKYPQLVRRLREGMLRDTVSEHRKQFTCEKVDDVIRFLADNQKVPSLYEDAPATAAGLWQERPDTLRPLAERFPPLPPPRTPVPPQRLYDPNELTSAMHDQLGDDIDGYAIARAWFAYAQEPIPDCDETPGSTKEITDRALQRKPQKMTILIFRNHPPLTQASIAERLQQEGWFDDEPWNIQGWFPNDRFADGASPLVGGRIKWSLAAWEDARKRWERQGEEHRLLFASPAEEANMRQLASEFDKKFHLEGRRVPTLRTEEMDEHTLKCYKAAHYLFEYDFYRSVSNFPHQLTRATVESKEDTVAGRKGFHEAERLRMAAKYDSALAKYAATFPLWRDKVMLVNKDYRRDDAAQEDSYDWEYRYMRLWHDVEGKRLKERLTKAAHFMPFVPVLNPTDKTWIIPAPLSVVKDGEGIPLIGEKAITVVLSRKDYTPRKGAPKAGSPSPNDMKPPILSR